MSRAAPRARSRERAPNPQLKRAFSDDFSEMSFCDFAKAVKFDLSPGQHELCGVLFDKKLPKGELGERIFGSIEAFTSLAMNDPVTLAGARDVAVLVCGARGGKTRMCATRILHLALTLPLTRIAPGQIPVCVIVAPRFVHSREAFNYILGIAEVHPGIVLKNPRGDRTRGASVEVHRRDGVVLIECVPADAKGLSGRGRTLLAAIFDEVGMINSASGFVVNDVDIYQAIAPRVLAGGQVLLASTPWATEGLLFSAFSENFGKPRWAVVAHAPTLLLNPDQHEEVARERRRDPENAKREFDAEFGSTETVRYFSDDIIARVRYEDVTRPLEPMRDLEGAMFEKGALLVEADIGSAVGFRNRIDHAKYAAAGDLGFRRDAAALAILEDDGMELQPACLIEMRPKPGKPLDFGEVTKVFMFALRRFGIRTLISDQTNREALRSTLKAEGMVVEDSPTGEDRELWGRLRALAHENVLKVNTWTEAAPGTMVPPLKFLSQLEKIRYKLVGGQKTKIEIVRRAGAHGDMAVSVAHAAYKLRYAKVVKKAAMPEVYTEAWQQAVVEKQAAEAKKRALGKEDDDKKWGSEL